MKETTVNRIDPQNLIVREETKENMKHMSIETESADARIRAENDEFMSVSKVTLLLTS